MSVANPYLKPIIISLIKDHLLHTRFIDGMKGLGFYSEHYHLDLAGSIFKLIGISTGDDELFERYLDWCSKIGKADVFQNKKALQEYAEKIYNMLLMEVSG